MRALILGVCLSAAVSAAAADRVDEHVRAQLTARKLPGAAVAVVQGGRIVKSAGYGVASLELSAPVTPQTVFEIGSISKQFTANAILLLVEDGKLRLDDPVAKYVERTPPAWAAITIRHILTHTAGLADFDTGNIGFSYRREYTPDEFVALLAGQPLHFPPGDRWAYSNAFPLLGSVIERASGMPYTSFVQERIFKKLGLESARRGCFQRRACGSWRTRCAFATAAPSATAWAGSSTRSTAIASARTGGRRSRGIRLSSGATSMPASR